MEKFIHNDIKGLAIKNGTWLKGLNSAKPIFLVITISFVLAGIAIVNHY